MKTIRPGQGRNEPPKMTGGIVAETPIFNYRDLLERHSAGLGRLSSGTRVGRPPAAVESALDLDGVVGGTMCWSGWCPGCGKALVSATTRSHVRPDAFYCTAACREAQA